MLESPFNYTGSKQRTLDFLFENFDTSKKIFIDVFGGGGCVSLTAIKYYDQVILNDVIVPLISFYKELNNIPYDSIIERLNAVRIDKTSQQEYNDKRKEFNDNGAKDPYLFFSLCSSCTNNMMRFNNKYLFNQTFGKRTINESTLKKLKKYSDILYKNKNITFSNKSFEKFLDFNSIDLSNCFVYLDPPYIQTGAGYNCYWNKNLENKLYDIIDLLNENQISFAMSNTLYHKGILNENYDRFKKYNVIEVPEFYNKVAKKDLDKKSVEILITNYQK